MKTSTRSPQSTHHVTSRSTDKSVFCLAFPHVFNRFSEITAAYDRVNEMSEARGNNGEAPSISSKASDEGWVKLDLNEGWVKLDLKVWDQTSEVLLSTY